MEISMQTFVLSNNSIAFQNMSNLFEQPLVSLLLSVKFPQVFFMVSDKILI
jgi:hypothetical protein